MLFELNNPTLGQDADWPYATAQSTEQVLKKIGILTCPQDKVMVQMMSKAKLRSAGAKKRTTLAALLT